MDLRAKVAIALLFLLVVPFVVVTTAQIDQSSRQRSRAKHDCGDPDRYLREPITIAITEREAMARHLSSIASRAAAIRAHLR